MQREKEDDFVPLTHVRAWDPQIGYRPVTVEEADELYPYTVSCNSGLFACELCAQNVGFTKARIDTGTRYFFHSSTEQDKFCEDRQRQLENTYSQTLRSLSSHTMPIRISVSGSSFTLQMGFFFPPENQAYCDRIRILADSHQIHEYSFERIEKNGTTYLDIGNVPSRVYGIEYVNANTELKKYWPNKVNGINALGSFFDGKTGHILPSGAKAYYGLTYYLLQRHRLYSYPNDLIVSEISRIQMGYDSVWYLYRVQVKQFTAEAARFFLTYSVFLTKKPVKFYPIWPVYIEDELFIYHNSVSFYYYLCGDDTELKSYPASSRSATTQDGRLYRLYTIQREQLVSIGKSGALGFSYLIREPLTKKATVPTVKISDQEGIELIDDCYSSLPKSKFIYVTCKFDGKAIIYKNGKQIITLRLPSGVSTIIDDLSNRTEIRFFQGCDCVRTIKFEKSTENYDVAALDYALVSKLQICTGPMVPVTHAIGATAKRFAKYPKTRQWILNALRQGEIPRQALRVLSDNIPKG